MVELTKLHVHKIQVVLAMLSYVWGSNVYFKSMFGYDLLGFMLHCAITGKCNPSGIVVSVHGVTGGAAAITTRAYETRSYSEPTSGRGTAAGGGGRKSGHHTATTEEDVFPVETTIWLLLSIFFLIMTAWAYLRSTFSDAGKVPKMFEFASCNDENSSGQHDHQNRRSTRGGFSGGAVSRRGAATSSEPNSARGEGNTLSMDEGTDISQPFMQTGQACMLCNLYKPPRAHHCSSCNRCSLRYDHHCPWIANCVGFGNMKYFLLFLFYFSLYCIVITMAMGRTMFLALLIRYSRNDAPLSHLAGKTAHQVKHLPTWHHGGPTGQEVLRLDNFTLLLAAFVASSITVWILRKQWRLTSQNITTVEAVLQGNTRFDSPYDVGRTKNLETVFGIGPFWRRWVPVAPTWGNMKNPGTCVPGRGYGTLVAATAGGGGGRDAEEEQAEMLKKWLQQEGAFFEYSALSKGGPSSPNIQVRSNCVGHRSESEPAAPLEEPRREGAPSPAPTSPARGGDSNWPISATASPSPARPMGVSSRSLSKQEEGLGARTT